MANQQRNIVVRFFLGILRFIRNYFVFVGVVTTLLWIGALVVLLRGPSVDFDIPTSTVALSTQHPAPLRLDLAGKIAEHQPGFSDSVMAHFLGGDTAIYLPKLRLVLQRAASDARISELQVMLMPLAGSPANFAELRRIIADFHEVGNKPVRFYLAAAQDWGYYLASVATTITLNPAGEVSLPGPSFQLMYFGDALKKLGVGIDVVRAGKYKSAFEPFIANKPSDPTLEEYSSLQKSLLDHIVAVVAKGRNKSEAVVHSWYKQSLFTTESAIKAGIIDGVGYPPADHGPADQGETASDPVSLSDYASATHNDKGKKESVKDQGGIALIEAVGEISLSGAGHPSSSDGISPADMHKQVAWALETDEVKAVVLRISSPGGSATASDMIWNDIKALADKKPLVVSMGAYAASGGYYIAAPARKIIAEPTTITGSIGVIGMLPSAKNFEEKWGISFYTVTSSDRHDMLNLGSRASAEDKVLLEKTIDEVYRVFMQRVADGRHIPLDKVAALAQGRVYTGLQGKQLGLVDEIGGLHTALTEAKRMAGFDVTKLYPILHYEDDGFSLRQCLRHPSPAKLAKCLGGVKTQLSLPLLPLLTAPSPLQIESKLQGWLENTRQERSLMLWPGYLSVHLR